jgi:hypothetical protein
MSPTMYFWNALHNATIVDMPSYSSCKKNGIINKYRHSYVDDSSSSWALTVRSRIKGFNISSTCNIGYKYSKLFSFWNFSAWLKSLLSE